MIIYYNPECSKCKEARALLEGAQCQLEIRNYLEVPPNRSEILELIQRLGCSAEDLVRKAEPIFVERFSGKNYSEEEWIDLLTKNPVLLQRPIVIDGKKAVIGRPPVLVLDLVEKK